MRLQALVTLMAVSLAGVAVAGTALAGSTAGPRQSLDDIRQAVGTFVREQSDGPGSITAVHIERLDPRLRLRSCGQPLDVWQPKGYSSAGRLTVGVRCPGPAPWKLYVPVQLTRTIRVVVTRHPLARGARVTRDDVELAEKDVSRLRDQYYTAVDNVVGQETAQSVSRGKVLEAGNLNAPRLVQRGQTLLIEAGDGPVVVKMQGQALEDGQAGDLIRVRNRSSQRIVQARVVARDRVRVTF